MAPEQGADAQLDALISKRSEGAEREREALYAQSVRTYHEDMQRSLLEERREYHIQHANRLEQTMLRLVAEHRSQAAHLSDILSGIAPWPEIDLRPHNGETEIL